MAGYSLMMVVTLAFVPVAFQGGAPGFASPSHPAGERRGSDCAAFAAAPPPRISISIEPAALAPYAEAESPVVFPGYLLPDDGCEEPAHAGS